MSVVSLNAFKLYLGSETHADDSVIQAALDAADVAIAEDLGRAITLVASDATPTTRHYVPSGTNVLRIHDCIAVTAVTTSGTVVSASAYQLEPVDALSWSGQARPYEQIRLLRSCWNLTGQHGEATVAVTGRFGWLAYPATLIDAAKILAKDIVSQREIRSGVADFGQYGAVRVRDNAYVARLVGTLRRAESWGIG